MDIAEKRVYEDDTGRTLVAVASEMGLVVAAVSGDIIGEFGLAHRSAVSDVDVLPDGRLGAATDDGVLAFDPPERDRGPADGPDPELIHDAPATAISATDDGFVVATGDGLRRFGPDATEGEQLGSLTDIRDAEGAFLATGDGIVRVGSEDTTGVGLDDATAVSGDDPILAGTADGLYRLGNGWLQDAAGSVGAVASRDGRALAVVDGDLLAFDGDEWTHASWSHEDPPVDCALGEHRYAVTRNGTLAVDAGDGWRTRALGVQPAEAVIVWRVA